MTSHEDKVIEDLTPAQADGPSAPVEAEPVNADPVEAEPVETEPAEGSGEGLSWRELWDRLVHSEKLTETLRAERDEYLDLARRAQADLVNYRQRIVRQQSEQLERAGEALLVRLLPLVDAVDAAAQQHPQTAAPLQKLLRSVLEAEGVERVEPTGEPFDPAVAEAVEHQGEGDSQLVVEVRRPGFRWKGRLLRPASVKVRSQASTQATAAADAATGRPSEESSGQG